MVDSGATGVFVDSSFASLHGFSTTTLSNPLPVKVIDGRPIASGAITQSSSLAISIGTHVSTERFLLTRLQYPVVLGLPFLRNHDPSVSFRMSALKFDKPQCTSHVFDPAGAPASIPSAFDTLSLEPPSPPPNVELVSKDQFTTMLQRNPDIECHFLRVLEGEESLALQSTEAGPEPAYPDPVDSPEYVKRITAIVPAKYHAHLEVFSQARASQLPPHRAADHAIDLVPDAKPTYSRIYPLSQPELDHLAAWIKENLDKGFIRPSKSPFGAGILFVKKKDGSLRLCVDYRALNSVTVKNRLAIPLISETLDRLSHARIFTKLDLKGAYNLLRIKEGDEWKTAFRTRYGHFETLVMPFGLSNAPASFQAIMNNLFRDILDVYVLCYLDDILVFSEHEEDHPGHVNEVLRRLQEAQLYVNPDKCEFDVYSTEYLGYAISPDGVRMCSSKVDSVLSWPAPTTLKQLQGFLGFANFYRRFIPAYSRIILPLTAKLKKNAKFAWTDKCQAAFDKLKSAFTSSPVLQHFSPDLPTRIETDASDAAIAAILSQRSTTDKKWHPVAYHSRKLGPAELNYTVSEKEILAIVDAITVWRHYVEGAESLQVLTDHQSIVTFRKPQLLTRRQSRWRQALAPYRLEFVYRSGVANRAADALSRRCDLMKGGNAKEAAPQVLLEPVSEKFLEVSAAEARMRTASERMTAEQLTARIKDILPLDPLFLEQAKKDDPDFEVRNNLLYRQDSVYVPADSSLRATILFQAHDSPLAGHVGRDKTLANVQRHYWWPGMAKYVQDYVSGCDMCQRTKAPRHRPHGLLQPLPVPSTPWSHITLDHITQLPRSNGFDAILVVVDRFTKMAIFAPAETTDDAPKLAKQFIRCVFANHGLPEDIVSDRGPTFASSFFRALCSELGIHSSLSTAYHPQSDGQTERTNQILEQYLRCYLGHLQDDWHDLLPIAQFAYNSTTQSSTQQAPFFLNYGRLPRGEITPSPTTLPMVNDYLSELKTAQNLAHDTLKKAQERYKHYADLRRQDAPIIRPGHKVLVRREGYVPSDRPSSSLDYRFIGPYKVLKRVGPSAYQLELPEYVRIHNVFHVSRLEPYRNNRTLDRLVEPPPPHPELVDGQAHHTVERILDSRRHGRGQVLQYFVHFQGYPVSDREWVPASDLNHDALPVVAFHSKYPSKPITQARRAALDRLIHRQASR